MGVERAADNALTLADTVRSTFRRTSVPLVAYYVVTIVIPIANGSGKTSGSFLEHLSFVALAPPALLALLALIHHAWQRAM